jgi:hypothetical protein
VATLGPDDQISQAQYSPGRDQFLVNAATTVEVAQQTEREARLQHEQARLKKLVGELALELKKATRRSGHDPAGLGGRRATECVPCAADPGSEGQTPMLGLSAHLGAPAVSWTGG